MGMFDERSEPRLHYRVASGPCHEALTKWREARSEIEGQHWGFTKAVGGVGFYAGHDDHVGNASAVSAVIFEGDLPKGWKRRNWKSFNGLKSGQTAAWPDQRTKDGKAALAAIKALPLRPSSYGPCREIGYPTSLEYEEEGRRGSIGLGLFETLKAGWIAGVFYVSLPDEKRIREGLTDDGCAVKGDPWEPLPGMEKILKEEMELDFARHRAELAAKGTPA